MRIPKQAGSLPYNRAMRNLEIIVPFALLPAAHAKDLLAALQAPALARLLARAKILHQHSSEGLAPTLPRKAPKKAVPTRRGVAFWVTREDGAVLLRRRPEKGLLGGMMEVPSTQWAARVKNAEAQSPLAAEWRKLKGVVEHTFTHFHLELSVWHAEKVIDGVLRDDGDYRWTKREALDGEALPTVMRKVVAHVQGR